MFGWIKNLTSKSEPDLPKDFTDSEIYERERAAHLKEIERITLLRQSLLQPGASLLDPKDPSASHPQTPAVQALTALMAKRDDVYAPPATVSTPIAAIPATTAKKPTPTQTTASKPEVDETSEEPDQADSDNRLDTDFMNNLFTDLTDDDDIHEADE